MTEHVQARGLTGNPSLTNFIAQLVENLNTENGQDIFSLPEKERKDSADMLEKKARQIVREQFIPAAGISFVAMALKASCLPGEDAEFVKHHCGEIIKAAIYGS